VHGSSDWRETGDVQYDGDPMRRTVSVVQHVVRNVTARVRSWARRLDAWMLVAAAIALPLLAALQYRWLSDLADAQRMESHQKHVEAVARGAAAINSDVSTFYTAIVEGAPGHADHTAIDRAVSAWKHDATTLGPFALIYARDARSRRWVPLGGSPALDDDRSIARLGSGGNGIPLSASWLPSEAERPLPTLVVWLDRSEPGIDAVVLTFARAACTQLLRAIADEHFDVPSGVRLAIGEGSPTRVSCADTEFDLGRHDETRAPLFRLRPQALARRPLDDARRSLGVMMSRDVDTPGWTLHAQDATASLTFGARGIHTRNLWTAAGLELTLVAAIIGVAMAARRERRTAAEHVRVSAVVAHELRTPLAAIKVLAQNQARGVIRSQHQIEHYGATIASEVDRLHQFVERVLQFTERRNAYRPATDQPVDFEQVIVDAVHPLAGRIAAGGITIQSHVEPAARYARGDETAFVLAVRNLVQNALDHGAGAHTIVIDVHKRRRHVVVAVTDDGAGVAEADRASLFEPFVRGSGTGQRRVRGHGIGLTIVRDVARAHGGRASYEHTSTGSRFVFTVLVRSERNR
jgi:signal transduction histidine kinase